MKYNQIIIHIDFFQGEYSFKDYVYDGEFFVPIFYGDFMCDFTFIKDNTIFMCIRMYCKSSPKNAFKFGR